MNSPRLKRARFVLIQPLSPDYSKKCRHSVHNYSNFRNYPDIAASRDKNPFRISSLLYVGVGQVNCLVGEFHPFRLDLGDEAAVQEGEWQFLFHLKT